MAVALFAFKTYLQGYNPGSGWLQLFAFYVPSNVVKVWLRLETGVCTHEGTSELVQRGGL